MGYSIVIDERKESIEILEGRVVNVLHSNSVRRLLLLLLCQKAQYCHFILYESGIKMTDCK